jgi:hypothetical protein
MEPQAPDMNFVNQYAGQAPVAPTFQKPSMLEKIGAILSGIGGGPEYAMQLREERQRPQRRYEAEKRDYEDRRTRGIEIEERRAEREADRANRAAEMQYEREYKTWLKKLDIRQDEADTRTKQAFDVYKLDRQAKLEESREAERERRTQEADAKARTGRFFTLTKDMAVSTELGRHYAGLSGAPLSAAAARWDARLQDVGEAQTGRALRVGGRGGSGGGVDKQTAKLIAEFNTAREALINATARGDSKGQKETRTRLDQLVRQLTGKPGVEVGYGGNQWPYLKVNGVLQGAPQQQAQPTAQATPQQQKDPLGIR